MEIYENQQQQPMYDYPQQQQQPMMQQPNIIQSNPDFMMFVFDFRKEVTMPLRHLWRGEELKEDGKWIKPEDNTPIMNEKGIAWGISLIDSYINAVYIVSNYDEKAMNWTIKTVGKIVWNTLTKNYSLYKLDKINIPRVANEIISKIHAILLGARGDGFRTFFTKTTSVSENRFIEQQAQKRPWYSRVGKDILGR